MWGALSDKRTGLPFTIAVVLASAVILGSESRGTRDHILLSQIRDSPNLESQVPVFISPRHRVVQLYPQALGSLFVSSYGSQGYDGGIRTHLQAGLRFLQFWDPRYIASGRPQQKSQFPNNSSIFIGVCLPCRSIETVVLLLLRACSFPREPVY
jgi:hypothetical protein